MKFFLNFFNQNDEWKSTLYTPTMIQKINDRYLIEDCWHNRIIYSKEISKPIKQWKTLSNEIFEGHTFASNDSGNIILCDNTDKDILEVYNEKFKLIQQIRIKEYLSADFSYRNNFNLVRPHFVFFDKSSQLFIVALSWANSLMLLKEDNSGKLSVVNITKLNINKDSYLKFISKFDDLIWISEKENWIGFEIIDEKLVEKKRYPIPIELQNQNFICKIKKKYFVTCFWGGKFL